MAARTIWPMAFAVCISSNRDVLLQQRKKGPSVCLSFPGAPIRHLNVIETIKKLLVDNLCGGNASAINSFQPLGQVADDPISQRAYMALLVPDDWYPVSAPNAGIDITPQRFLISKQHYSSENGLVWISFDDLMAQCRGYRSDPVNEYVKFYMSTFATSLPIPAMSNSSNIQSVDGADSNKPCKFFISQGHCKFNTNCKFRHDGPCPNERNGGICTSKPCAFTQHNNINNSPQSQMNLFQKVFEAKPSNDKIIALTVCDVMNQTVVFAASDRMITVYKIDALTLALTEMTRFSNILGPVGCILAEGGWVFCGRMGGVHSINLAVGAESALEGHPRSVVTALAAANDFLFSGGQDGRVCVYQHDSASQAFRPCVPIEMGSPVQALVYMRSFNRLIIAHQKGLCDMNLLTGAQVPIAADLQSSIIDCILYNDNHFLTAEWCQGVNRIRTFEITATTLVKVFELPLPDGKKPSGLSLHTSASGRILLSVTCFNSTGLVYECPTFLRIGDLPLLSGDLRVPRHCVAGRPGSAFMGYDDGFIRVYRF